MNEEYVLYYDDELKHYGIKGMRCGHRKKYYNDDGSLNARGQARQTMRDSKSAYKMAKKAYGKSYDKAALYSMNRPITSRYGKRKEKSDALWNDAKAKSKQADKAKAQYKKAKQDYELAKTGISDPKAAKKEVARRKAVNNLVMRAAGQTVAGIAMTAAGRAMTSKGKSFVGEHLTVAGASLLAGTAVGGIAGVAAAASNKKRRDKQQNG